MSAARTPPISVRSVTFAVNKQAFLDAMGCASRAKRGAYLLSKLGAWQAAALPTAPKTFEDADLKGLREKVVARRDAAGQRACLQPTTSFLAAANEILARYDQKDEDGVRLHKFPLLCPSCGKMRIYDKYGRLVLASDPNVVHFHCDQTENALAGKTIVEIIQTVKQANRR